MNIPTYAPPIASLYSGRAVTLRVRAGGPIGSRKEIHSKPTGLKSRVFQTRPNSPPSFIGGSTLWSKDGLSVLVVFLCLAALYESWSVPFAVMLVVPLGVLGTVSAVMLRGLQNDVFFQVGLLTTVGLAAKNAILIVEFAKEIHERDGKNVVDAAIEAAKLRIRPIIMTSMAFILGVFPLTISSGAGAGSQHSIGTAVIGGMISATFLAIFFVPLFYALVMKIAQRLGNKKAVKEVKSHG